MARYERDYGADYGRWGPTNAPLGGMRSDGWGGSDWRTFPGSEGWYGEGYEGMPNGGFDQPRAAWERGGPGRWYGPPSYGADFRGGYGMDYRYQGGSYGARPRDYGYAGRDFGYSEGWEDRASIQRGGRGRTRASELMTANPRSVTSDTPVSEAARMMRDLDVGIIPVIENEDSRRLKGVITDRDIAIRLVAEGKDANASVGDCMTGAIRCVNKNDSARDVMRVMRQEQVRRVPVVDREGRLVGIIAQADLAVDYAGEDFDREAEVGSTVERISEPARPGAMAAGEK